MNSNHEERIRAICLSLPEVTEKEAWGMPTFRVGRMFAMFANNHHNDGRIAVWCYSTVEMRQLLLDNDPERFFIPPYMGPSGWVGIHVDRTDDATLTDCLHDAYAGIAPKRLLKAWQTKAKSLDGSGETPV